MDLIMNNYYLFSAVSVFSAILAFDYYSTNESENTEFRVLNNEITTMEENFLVNEDFDESSRQEKNQLSYFVEKSKSNAVHIKKIQQSNNIENFSENVHNVREQIFLEIAPTKEDFISAMREVYKDRPASFKRNLERNFEEALNPKPYCNDKRKNWAEPYISEINKGNVFVNEQLWQKNSPSNKAQLSQYLSKCTQESQPFELVAQSSGYTVAYYSLRKGYQPVNL